MTFPNHAIVFPKEYRIFLPYDIKPQINRNMIKSQALQENLTPSGEYV